MMTYKEKERNRIVQLRDQLFKDPGNGILNGRPYPFVLQNPLLNLYEPIRQDALDYFQRNHIQWWGGDTIPTGHLLSSQIACINHLFPLRHDPEAILLILQSLDPEISQACLIDDGYVEFEVIGKENHLNEYSHSRGRNTTSIDALMVGEKPNGSRILFSIEWKYTESYPTKSVAISEKGTSRVDIYRPLLEDPDCLIQCDALEALFYEPYYQLMRQTLLSWQMTQALEYGTSDWQHIHVIPDENKELKNTNPSPELPGNTMETSWKSILKNPERYIVLSPENLIKPIEQHPKAKALNEYLMIRYWKKIK
jgi:hypothetical protein